MTSFSDATDEELMQAYQGGSEEAFRHLFDRHSAKIYGFLVKHLKDRAQVDDVFQNTFLKLHRTRSKYDPSLPVRGWLFAICKTVMLDFIRKRNRHQAEELNDDYAPTPAITNDSSISKTTEQLPEQQRRVISLRFNEDMTFEEIAARLETTPANARQLVSRAIRRLKILASQGGK